MLKLGDVFWTPAANLIKMGSRCIKGRYADVEQRCVVIGIDLADAHRPYCIGFDVSIENICGDAVDLLLRTEKYRLDHHMFPRTGQYDYSGMQSSTYFLWSDGYLNNINMRMEVNGEVIGNCGVCQLPSKQSLCQLCRMCLA